MLSMLVFMYRDPGGTTSKVFCCASFIAIMLLHEGLTHIHSQIKPWLLFGESFTLISEQAICLISSEN